ncbi:L,D-transpeptidase family protein [Tropicimonas sp.]|uniref:L,D-transpeptidase family protein n=1 Tax=Tropicimonas sp. TaxID=2067044 RepID=UPI003A8A3D30
MISGGGALLAAWLAPIAAGGIAAWDAAGPPDLLPPPPALTQRIDRIVVYKHHRRLIAYRGGEALKGYSIGLGFAPEGDKSRQGDGRTPEGLFRIDQRNGQSQYHLSLGIDYPQPEDVRRAAELGVSPGGDIFIHGQPNQRKGAPDLRGDWTAGCMAVSDAGIEELWRVVPLGTEVEILP